VKASVQALGRLAPGAMNKTEAAYAGELEALQRRGLVSWWRFEAATLKLAPDLRLTPDFLVMACDGRIYSVDVKGSKHVYTDDAKAKMKMAASIYPWPFFVAIPKPKRDGGGWEVIEVKA
jgi:hypothetical protein